jgi:hypothetical protein
MTTPEGKVKAKVRKIFAEFPSVYTYWPVPSGYGRTSLDIIGCYRGQFFSVETKAAGKKPTLRQYEEISRIGYAMGKSFVISGEDSPVLEELRAWLRALDVMVTHDPYFPPDEVRRRSV